MTQPVPTVSTRAQFLLPGLVGLLGVAAVSPLADILLSRWPVHLDQVQDRFRVMGLVYAIGPQAAVMLVLLALIGLVGSNRAVLRAGAMIALGLASIFVILIPFFLLDGLQMRRIVPQAQMSGFQLAAVKTFAFAMALVPVLFVTGRRGLRSTLKPTVAGRHQRTKGEGLIVAQDQDGEK